MSTGRGRRVLPPPPNSPHVKRLKKSHQIVSLIFSNPMCLMNVLFKDQGGLNLRSCRVINHASMLNLGWEILISELYWTSFLRGRFLRNKQYIYD